MSITIYDIAKATNKSHATVSRALRDHPRISKEVTRKIKQTAKRLGYRPGHAAQALKLGKTFTIGLVIPDFTNPYHVEFLREVEQECLARGFQLVAMEYAMDAARERLCLERLLGRQCDGVIAGISRFEPLKSLLNEFWESRIPCVVAGLPSDIGTSPVDGTSIDIGEGVELAVDHLVELGHRNITMISSWPKETAGAGRIPGLQSAFEKHDLKYDDSSVFRHYTGNQLRDGYEASRKLLVDKPETTAIIGVNDLLVAGVMRGLSEMGLQVPRDISLVGTDNTWIGEYWPVAQTSIDLKTQAHAKAVANLLFDRLDDKDWKAPKHLRFQADLVVRESTGPVRTV